MDKKMKENMLSCKIGQKSHVTCQQSRASATNTAETRDFM